MDKINIQPSCLTPSSLFCSVSQHTHISPQLHVPISKSFFHTADRSHTDMILTKAVSFNKYTQFSLVLAWFQVLSVWVIDRMRSALRNSLFHHHTWQIVILSSWLYCFTFCVLNASLSMVERESRKPDKLQPYSTPWWIYRCTVEL